MKKRMLTALLTCCLALSLAVPALGAQAAVSEDEAAQAVTALGIMTGDASGDLDLSGQVTRAEFVTMAVKAQLRNQKPVILAVSTNDGLSGSAKNIGLLMNCRGIYFVPMAQDDPEKKPTSLVAVMERVPEAVEAALEGRQLQPILLGPPEG